MLTLPFIIPSPLPVEEAEADGEDTDDEDTDNDFEEIGANGVNSVVNRIDKHKEEEGMYNNNNSNSNCVHLTILSVCVTCVI